MTWELNWVEWAGRYLSHYQISTLEAPKKSLLDLINASTSLYKNAIRYYLQYRHRARQLFY
jgi:hypothetical protein